jgi:hypothetical protein
VIEVTNLNAGGAGSLEACLLASGPRTCVFRLGGTIDLGGKNISIRNPSLTIAGHTAPGGGVLIKNGGLRVETHDVIIRYLRIRPGAWGSSSTADGNDAMDLSSWGGTPGVSDIIIDHSSLSWAVDEVASIWGPDPGIRHVTYQWNFITESLHCANHPKGCHGKGFLAGGGNGITLSFHHNFLAHHDDRNPLIHETGVTDFRNNLVYNWSDSGSSTKAQFGHNARVNFVNNHYLPGPSSVGNTLMGWINSGATVYMEGNWGPQCPAGCADDWELGWLDGVESRDRALTPFAAPPVATDPAAQVKDRVLSAGASHGLACDGTFVDRHDAVDARLVNGVIHGTGQIIDDPSEVGGYPTLAAGTPCSDGDHDGMPDAWEAAQGLNPADAGDRNGDLDGDGYTNLEEYLNGSAGPPSLPGDVNGDHAVNLDDLRELLRMLTGQVAPVLERADLTGDGKVSLADARELVGILASGP